MRALLDVNVLVALLDPQHAAHTAANQWLAVNSEAGWASCPMTENGYLRVLTNRRYSNPLTGSTALAKLQATRNNGNHKFWSDDLSIVDTSVFNWSHLQGHQQVTDIYLLALAVEHGGRLVTFDQHIQCKAVTGSSAEHLVML